MSGSAPRAKNKFGGAWTIEKLSFLKRYLAAYTRIMTSNERARFFKTSYVDAFAGSGTISREYDSNQTSVFNGTDEFIEGSAMVALENYPSFDKYYFIEKSSSRCKGLRELAANYPGIASRVQISEGDANSELSEWIEKTEWRTNRAVVFLDPFGMQVDWNVIEQLALTKAVDLWLLFPLGTGVMRLMTKDKFPTAKAVKLLDRVFGSSEWQKRFYKKSSDTEMFPTLFEAPSRRSATTEEVAHYVLNKLQDIFAAVFPHPIILANSKDNPMYLLCFAASNEKGAKPAMNIVRSLFRNRNGK